MQRDRRLFRRRPQAILLAGVFVAAWGLAARPVAAGEWQVTLASSSGSAEVSITPGANSVVTAVVNGTTYTASQTISLAGQDRLDVRANLQYAGGPGDSASVSVDASLSLTYRVQWQPAGGSLSSDPPPAAVNVMIVHNPVATTYNQRAPEIGQTTTSARGVSGPLSASLTLFHFNAPPTEPSSFSRNASPTPVKEIRVLTPDANGVATTTFSTSATGYAFAGEDGAASATAVVTPRVSAIRLAEPRPGGNLDAGENEYTFRGTLPSTLTLTFKAKVAPAAYANDWPGRVTFSAPARIHTTGAQLVPLLHAGLHGKYEDRAHQSEVVGDTEHQLQPDDEHRVAG